MCDIPRHIARYLGDRLTRAMSEVDLKSIFKIFPPKVDETQYAVTGKMVSTRSV